ncbi:MAG: hypothetical protein N3D84_03735 [Candidatus Woesearchaeota archaeon]|nr:hypothetical protein [Candidatus Woesearchaeota archaeon]
MAISHHRARTITRGRNRKRRPKTFSTEEAAKKWAEKKGIKNYELVNLRDPWRKDKKIKIVAKNNR